MHFPLLCKRLLLAGALFLLSMQAIMAHEPQEERLAEKDISQLYRSMNNKLMIDMSTRITTISAQFLGKPYLLGALGEGAAGDYDQSPLYRTDAFDCETYVDTVVALALTHNPEQFKRRINQIRYHEGHVSYVDRNHFTCLDWNLNNQHQGFLKDITTTFKNEHHQTVAKFARAFIDKPAWYKHKSTNDIRMNNMGLAAKLNRLESLKREGSHLPRASSVIPYLPLTALFNSAGKANKYLFNQIPNAAIIEIIRPNWDLTQTIGTHMNVSHLGFAIWERGTLFYREASSTHQRILDIPLEAYLRDAQKSPTIKGINIQIVLPTKNMR